MIKANTKKLYVDQRLPSIYEVDDFYMYSVFIQMMTGFYILCHLISLSQYYLPD
jgi:hypothetical protein